MSQSTSDSALARAAAASTQQYYDRVADKFTAIHARPVQVYSAARERELMAPYLGSVTSILDLGCGEGRTTRLLAELTGAEIVGVDISPEMVRIADSMKGDSRVGYRVGDALRLDEPSDSFDLVTCFTSFNNMPDPPLALSEIRRVLRPGGMFLATVINSYDASRVMRGLLYWPYYLARMLAGHSSGFRQTYTRASLRRLVEKAGFDVIDLRGQRLLSDLIPEVPFNVTPAFAGAMTRVLRALAPADRRLCNHPKLASLARLHFLAARKP
jgi:ubiquinone/menaquinone biosynthesis C-methylase UbiE